MTKKKRELIEILLDNVKPEDWPDDLPYAAQDSKSMNVDYPIYAYKREPVNSSEFPEMWNQSGYSAAVKIGATPKDLCKHWNKTIVHRDEFMKRWNERNTPVVNLEGWIQWSGGEMPVENGTLIDVKYKNGETNLHISAGSPLIDNGSLSGKYAYGWWSSESPWSITAYRMHVPKQQKTPQQVALEKFGTDWHDNEGVQPVDDGVLVDVMFFNETKSYTADPACIWGWRVDRKSSSEIKKWRIHSDEKESQIKEKENAIESLLQLMPPCSEGIPCHFVDVKSPLSTQIGGDHYTKLAIQPMRYSMENGLDPLQHTIIKYVTRFRDKAGIEDLEKAKHCIDMLIEFERDK